MSAIQQVDRINFGTGRILETQPGGYPLMTSTLTDISVDMKVDLKEAYAENGFPIGVADGHRSIDVTAKQYVINATIVANSMNGTVTSGTAPQVFDEAHIVPASSAYTVAATNGATYVANTMVVLAFPLTGGLANPKQYSIVTAGSEVAGSACSVSATGVVTFAAGDAGIACQLSYQYTSTNGTRVTVNSTAQNSQKVQQLVAVKRDISPIDNSTGELVLTLFAVKQSGIKAEWKEGDYTVYERMYKAFANTAGAVYQWDFLNQ